VAKKLPTKKKDAAANPRRGKVVKVAVDAPATFESGASAAAPVGFDAEEVCEEMKIFWKSGDGDNFYMKSPTEGRWDRWTKDATVDAMRSLPNRLIAIKAREGEQVSEAKRVLLHVRRTRALDEVLPSLPGYESKVHRLDSGERVLVKNAPKLVVPVEGEWENIRMLIDGRLDLSEMGGVDQTPWFHSWCKVAAESIREGEPGHWRAGHAMILTGPKGCGKNRLQEQIITPLLGGYGRFADPAKFLFEADEFNGDVFSAEHLMLSEIPTPSQRTVDRTSLAEKIKQVVANPAQRMRLMRTEPCSVSPFWRLTISVNDDREKLRSLPVITADFGDKVLIFHCASGPLPVITTNSIENQREFREVMERELPCYLHWLLNVWEVPEELKTYGDGKNATRFGFREYHAPIIRDELWDDSPAAKLLALIDSAVFTRGSSFPSEGDDAPGAVKLWDMVGDKETGHDEQGMKVRLWHGKAETLELLLTGEGGWHCSVVTLAKSLFRACKCSRLLGSLHDNEAYKDVRISKRDTRNWKGWLIAPPSV
jgi:hypothetical protein